MIVRDISDELLESASKYPVVIIIGPRQSGKTTLARMTFPRKPYLSLDDPDVRLEAESDPTGFLAKLKDGAVLDDARSMPTLHALIENIPARGTGAGRFILIGNQLSPAPELFDRPIAAITKTLALWPLSLRELRRLGTPLEPFKLIVRGCFPRAHEKRIDTRAFFNDYVRTLIDNGAGPSTRLRQPDRFHLFLKMLAGRVGQILNLASLSNDVGVSATTIRAWIDALEESHIVFELPPFVDGIRRRVIRAPKIYFTDVGLAAHLLGIHTEEQAARDQLRESLYENLLIADVVKGALNRGIVPEIFYFRDSHGNEMDLIIRRSGVLIPVVIRSAETFSREFLKGIERFQALGFERVAPPVLLYGGERRFRVDRAAILNPFHANDLWRTLVKTL
jgi:uncharacterized protein